MVQLRRSPRFLIALAALALAVLIGGCGQPEPRPAGGAVLAATPPTPPPDATATPPNGLPTPIPAVATLQAQWMATHGVTALPPPAPKGGPSPTPNIGPTPTGGLPQTIPTIPAGAGTIYVEPQGPFSSSTFAAARQWVQFKQGYRIVVYAGMLGYGVDPEHRRGAVLVLTDPELHDQALLACGPGATIETPSQVGMVTIIGATGPTGEQLIIKAIQSETTFVFDVPTCTFTTP